MHLIQEMQDHPKALIIHAHLVFEIADQLGPREIHVGEGEFVGGARGVEDVGVRGLTRVCSGLRRLRRRRR